MKSVILPPSSNENLPDFDSVCLVVYQDTYSSAKYVVLVNPEHKGCSNTNFAGTVVYSQHSGHKVGSYNTLFVKKAFKLYTDQIALEN
jgi:hypothetical protein